MYENKKINVMILAASLLVFAGSLFMVRSQTTVNDTAWMKAMIPHHSIAILTSKRADLKDPEVKKLAEEIIQAQEEEIDKMKKMIKEMELPLSIQTEKLLGNESFSAVFYINILFLLF